MCLNLFLGYFKHFISSIFCGNFSLFSHFVVCFSFQIEKELEIRILHIKSPFKFVCIRGVSRLIDFQNSSFVIELFHLSHSLVRCIRLYNSLKDKVKIQFLQQQKKTEKRTKKGVGRYLNRHSLAICRLLIISFRFFLVFFYLHHFATDIPFRL